MSSRPKADISALAMPKGDPATGQSQASASGEPRGYAHTLSLRLTAEQYRRLRRYVAHQEDQTGRRVTHQAIIETALGEFLDRKAGSGER